MWINLYNEFADILNEKYKSDAVFITSQKKKATEAYRSAERYKKRTLMADFNGRSRFKRPFPEHATRESRG